MSISLADKLAHYSPSCFDMAFFAVKQLRREVGGEYTLDQVLGARKRLDRYANDPQQRLDDRTRYARAWAAFHDEPLIAGEVMVGLVADDGATAAKYDASPQVEWVERVIA
jgi:hypothetical protein